MTVTYGFEHERRLRAGFIGCGGHSFRNVYPVLRYLPVDLVAVCDLDADRAAAYASTFGAERSYTDHQAMLAPRASTACSSSPACRRTPTSPSTACRPVCAVWTEKPPVASLDDVARDPRGRWATRSTPSG